MDTMTMTAGDAVVVAYTNEKTTIVTFDEKDGVEVAILANGDWAYLDAIVKAPAKA
jgi:hypothetical protein